MKLIHILLSFLIFLNLAGCTSWFKPVPVDSLRWNDYVNGSDESFILNFSYAGFKNGNIAIPTPEWELVNVNSFGAVPDDGLSDTQAIRDAIRYAETLDKAIVFFDKGTYIIEPIESNFQPILMVHGSDIILKGSGSGEYGTKLFFPTPLKPENPDKLWSTPHMIVLKGSKSFYKGKTVTHIDINASKGDLLISVQDTSDIKVGDFIVLNIWDEGAIKVGDVLSFDPLEEWHNLERGEFYREYHRVTSVNGKTIGLESPLLMDIDASFIWQVRKIDLGKMIGVQDIAFIGNWNKEFKHHKNALHDSGWSALRMEQVADSWIKNITFKDWNETFTVNGSMNVSIVNTYTKGNRGHFGIHVTSSSRVLVANSLDCTNVGQYHAFSVSSYASGTVFYNVGWPTTTSFDTHARYPHATLFDNAKGGFLVPKGGNGGGRKNKPNHMEDLVIWNFFSSDDKERKKYSWWNNNHVVKPKIFGWTGHLPIFDESELGELEGFGTGVLPKSLYRSQLENRLGFVPDWLQELDLETVSCATH